MKAIETIDYVSNNCFFSDIIDYKNLIYQILNENKDMVQVFKSKILVSIEKFLMRSREKWYISLFISEKIIYHALSVKDALRIYVFEKFFNEYTKLIIFCERKHALSQIIHFNKSKAYMPIWVDIFSKLSTLEFKVQLTPESNKIKYLQGLFTPFIYDDIKKLIDFYDYVLVKKISNEELLQNIQIYHCENSLWKEKSLCFYLDPNLQNNFISDFINVIQIEFDQESDHSEILFKIVLIYLNQFEIPARIPMLLEFKHKIVNFYEIFKIYSQISQTSLNELILRCMEENYEQYDNLITSLIKAMIQDIYPSEENIESAGSIKVYSRSLLKFKELIFIFSFF